MAFTVPLLQNRMAYDRHEIVEAWPVKQITMSVRPVDRGIQQNMFAYLE
jgi:hypothetical protein